MVFLEYYAGSSEGDRESRFVAAFGGWGFSVPEAIVGSGYRFTQGPADYEKVFRGMVEAEKARPPRMDLDAWWWKATPTTLRIYATVHNTSGLVLDDATNQAGVWGMAWENKPSLGVTGMYVRSARRAPLTPALAPGASVSIVVDLLINLIVDWNNLHSVVAAELRPAGTTGPYDMLQAVRPQPASFAVSQSEVHLAVPKGPSAAELTFVGPHVLTWTASTAASWLSVTPASGTMASVARVEAQPQRPEPYEDTGTVTFTATSTDGMRFVKTVTVTASFDPTWSRDPHHPRRRLVRRAPARAVR